jgi:hypothetical protein
MIRITGYDTLRNIDYVSFILNGESRSVLDQPPELPKSEINNDALNNKTIQYAQDTALLCYPKPCLFNLDEDPSETNPFPDNYDEMLAFAQDILKNITPDYVGIHDAGLCQPGWDPLKTRDLTDFRALNVGRQCGMTVPWVRGINGMKMKKCQALF